MPRLTSPVFDRATARPFVLTFEDAVLGVEQADDDGEQSGSDMDSDEETHRAIITAAKQRMGGHIGDSESSESESDSDAAGSDSQRVRRDAIMITEHGSEETAGVVVSRRDKLHAQLHAPREAAGGVLEDLGVGRIVVSRLGVQQVRRDPRVLAQDPLRR